jgi:beta-lactam-binding protein with PASTA domain
LSSSRAVLLLAVAALVLAGCGSSGGTTTVIKESPAETVERTTTVEAEPAGAEASSSKPPAQKQKAPNVVDLPLDVAEELLEEAGYRVAATNTDTTFGIIDPSNYTICTQDPPRGTIVPVLAQKYGC